MRSGQVGKDNGIGGNTKSLTFTGSLKKGDREMNSKARFNGRERLWTLFRGEEMNKKKNDE